MTLAELRTRWVALITRDGIQRAMPAIRDDIAGALVEDVGACIGALSQLAEFALPNPVHRRELLQALTSNEASRLAAQGWSTPELAEAIVRRDSLRGELERLQAAQPAVAQAQRRCDDLQYELTLAKGALATAHERLSAANQMLGEIDHAG